MTTRAHGRLALATLALAVLAWGALRTGAQPGARAGRGPRVIVLGTAQDGGLPHASCSCRRCAAARAQPRLARRVASLGVLVPDSGRAFLIDATPDLREQLERLNALRERPRGRVDRAPLDGVLLTHAHMGHYLGLAFFGLEAVHTRALPLHVSPRLAGFLRANGPWSQLVSLENVALRELQPGRPFALDEGLEVTAIPVPHRDEWSDTLAFVLRGPRHALLYVPDTDAWSAWPTPFPDVLRQVDHAWLDGTFWSAHELPDRDASKVRHPLVSATTELLAPLVARGRLRVAFTHLNHTNPLLDGDGQLRRALEARGFRVLDDGDELEL